MAQTQRADRPTTITKEVIMSTGAWDPDKKTTHQEVVIDAALLDRLLKIALQDSLEDLPNVMSVEDQQGNAIMLAGQSGWDRALKDYSDGELIALIKFFTLVEMQLPSWVGGSQSPVIAITAQLKHRGVKLERELLLWIRKNSTNRFIPNGAVL